MDTSTRQSHLLETMSTAGMHTDKAWRMVGLSSNSTAWLMYAYVGSRSDEDAFRKVVNTLANLVRSQKRDIPPRLSVKIAEMIIEQRLTGKSFSQRLCSVILSIPRATYQRHEKGFKLIYTKLDAVISDWESEAVTVIESHL
ncbi:hypothetical protein FCV55_08590 [Vibrio sp. F13]|nr:MULTISPECIES: hypothetical protein [Vibrio]TKF71107.1 hypothetical protein FCV55_08590 [Vibrio sp. F13]